jgi:acetyltransferase-like isoleucine patch superfamily enzyme
MGLLNNLKRKHEVYQKENKNASYIDFLFHSIPGVWRILIARLYLRKCNYVGKLVSVNNKPIIINDGIIELQDEVRVWSSIVRTKLYTGKNGKLIVGKNSRLNGVHIDARILVQIGENVRIAPYTIILDSDFHDTKDHFADGESKPVIIEDNVWLATRCTILKGVRIGKGSVVASGAVVTKDVPPACIVAGIPARIVKQIV